MSDKSTAAALPVESGEQEVGALVGKWRRLASYEDEEGELEVGSESAVRLIRCADELEAALRTKQPAASEGDVAEKEFFSRDFYEDAKAGKVAWPDGTYSPQANTSKQAAGEAQSEDMIDPVKIEISIPGELGKTIRFVERKWLYGNDQHHDDAPASARVEAMRTALTVHFTPPRHPADEGNK